MTKVTTRPRRRRPASRPLRPLPRPHASSERPRMFQRFASALFGDDVEEVNPRNRPGDCKGEEEEEDEDWILVNYLADACSGQCGDGLVRPAASAEEDEEEDEDLVMIPSPMASPPVRYASSTSLNSTADTDVDGGAEEDEDEEDGGFLRLDGRSLQESWFVTPPPCFTGSNSLPVLLETSPLENLLIEHPSMSVYCHPGLSLEPLPEGPLDLELDFLSGTAPAAPTASSGKEKARHNAEGPRHRPEAAAVQRRSSLPSACYAAALSAQAGLVQQRSGNAAQRAQPPSRKVLRRLNLLRPPKASNMHLHQPSQRRLNF